MKKIDVVLGLQWGDEGKGKVVDVLTPDYKVIARFQGGPNAGHSLVFDGDGFVLHTVPSGIFREDSVNVIGNGVVIDPVILMDEIHAIESKAGDITAKLRIAKRAHLILPTHRMLDAASEAAKGKAKIGSTLKGIGPTYMDKTGRNGLRIGDILSPEFKDRYDALKKKHFGLLAQYDFQYDITDYEKQWMQAVAELKRFSFIESELVVNDYLQKDVPVLAEGAQGSMLDIDFGTYPFVTSSNPTAGGACIGSGLSPRDIGCVVGVVKAYTTRVGEGPFPTELYNAVDMQDPDGKTMAERGHEFGAVTKRPRRTGWYDAVVARYSQQVNGVDYWALTKLDVLDTLPKIKICVAYELDGKRIETMPSTARELARVKPIYEEMDGWLCETSNITRIEDLPPKAKAYVDRLVELSGAKLGILSIGPARESTLRLAL